MTKSKAKSFVAMQLRKGDSVNTATVKWWENLGPKVAALAAEFQKTYGDNWHNEYLQHDSAGVRMGNAAYEDIKEKYGSETDSEFTKLLELAPLSERIAFALASCGSIEFDKNYLEEIF